MKITMAGLRRFAKSSSFCLLLLFAINAQADGMADNLPTPASIPATINVPALDHPVLVLADGRVLAAGGMATSNVSAGHAISSASELWDPHTGQWRSLGNDLRFDPDQRVHLNQLGDGRVLFFATREDGDKAEYQVRIWDPKSGTVEKLPVSAKPKLGTDIAVLADGRVLIINGNEGSADIWDSRANTVAHTEEPLLENSRWRALPLQNRQVLLVETFPDDPAATRRNVVSSVVLLWNPSSGEWKQISDLPVPFRDSSSLTELTDGVVQATIKEETYRLPALDRNWEGLSKPAPPAIAPKAEAAAVAQAVAAPPQQISPPARPAFAVDAAWISYAEAVINDLRLMIMLLPLLVLSILFRARENDLPYVIKPAIRIFQKSLAVVFLVFLAWIFLRNAPLQMLQAKLWRWWEDYRDKIAAIFAILAIFGPIPLYFILRRMEAEKLARFLNNASKAGRAILITIIVFLFVNSIAEDYIQRKQQADAASDEISWMLLIAAIDDDKWVLLALFVPIGLYMLLQRLKKEKLDRIVKHCNTALGAVAVGCIAFLILWGIYAYSENRLARNVQSCMWPGTLDKTQQWVKCVEEQNGILDSMLFNKTNEIVSSLPSVPCRYIGIWSSARSGSKSKITLTDDSRYIAEQILDKAGSTATSTGYWGAHGDTMVWFEDHRFRWPIDANTISPESRSRFSLIEVNGERTDFELIDAIKSNTCSL